MTLINTAENIMRGTTQVVRVMYMGEQVWPPIRDCVAPTDTFTRPDGPPGPLWQPGVLTWGNYFNGIESHFPVIADGSIVGVEDNATDPTKYLVNDMMTTRSSPGDHVSEILVQNYHQGTPGWQDTFERPGTDLGPNWIGALGYTNLNLAGGAAYPLVGYGQCRMYWHDTPVQSQGQAFEIEVENAKGNSGWFQVLTNANLTNKACQGAQFYFNDVAQNIEVSVFRQNAAGAYTTLSSVDLPYDIWATEEPIRLQLHSGGESGAGRQQARVNGVRVIDDFDPSPVVGTYTGMVSQAVAPNTSPRILLARGGLPVGAQYQIVEGEWKLYCQANDDNKACIGVNCEFFLHYDGFAELWGFVFVQDAAGNLVRNPANSTNMNDAHNWAETNPDASVGIGWPDTSPKLLRLEVSNAGHVRFLCDGQLLIETDVPPVIGDHVGFGFNWHRTNYAGVEDPSYALGESFQVPSSTGGCFHMVTGCPTFADLFERADGPLGSNWVSPPPGPRWNNDHPLRIVSGAVIADEDPGGAVGDDYGFAQYTQSVPGDQFIEMVAAHTVAPTDFYAFYALEVRSNTTDGRCFHLLLETYGPTAAGAGTWYWDLRIIDETGDDPVVTWPGVSGDVPHAWVDTPFPYPATIRLESRTDYTIVVSVNDLVWTYTVPPEWRHIVDDGDRIGFGSMWSEYDIGQTKVAPRITSVTAGCMHAACTTFTDDFARANGSLGPDWMLGPGVPWYSDSGAVGDGVHPLAISSGHATGTFVNTAATLGANVAYYYQSISGDQFVDVEVEYGSNKGNLMVFLQAEMGSFSSVFFDVYIDGTEIDLSAYAFNPVGDRYPFPVPTWVGPHIGTGPIRFRMWTDGEGNYIVDVDGTERLAWSWPDPIVDPGPPGPFSWPRPSGPYVGIGCYPVYESGTSGPVRGNVEIRSVIVGCLKPCVLFTDNFQRADGPIGPNWVQHPTAVFDTVGSAGAGGVLSIVDGAAVAPVNVYTTLMYWHESSPSDESQFIEIVVENVITQYAWITLHLNMSPIVYGSRQAEIEFYPDDGELWIDLGGLGSSGAVPIPTAEPVTLRFKSDPNGTLSAYVNGSAVVTAVDPIPPAGQFVAIELDPQSGVTSPRILYASGGCLGAPACTQFIDDFERPDGPLGPNWVVGPGAGWVTDPQPLEIDFGDAQAPTDNTSMMHWFESYGPNQFIEVTISALVWSGSSVGHYIGLHTNINDDGSQQYADLAIYDIGGVGAFNGSLAHFNADGTHVDNVQFTVEVPPFDNVTMRFESRVRRQATTDRQRDPLPRLGRSCAQGRSVRRADRRVGRSTG